VSIFDRSLADSYRLDLWEHRKKARRGKNGDFKNQGAETAICSLLHHPSGTSLDISQTDACLQPSQRPSLQRQFAAILIDEVRHDG
jgi:hypothetical protein